jgi:hypothetical protein
MITNREMQNILDQVNLIFLRLEKRLEEVEKQLKDFDKPTKSRRTKGGSGDGKAL